MLASRSALLASPARRVMNKFSGVSQAELLADVGAVGVHGFDAEIQRARDLVRFFALAEEAIDLELAIRELAHGTARPAFAAGHGIEDLRGDALADGDAA